jgi:hypothetical protein
MHVLVARLGDDEGEDVGHGAMGSNIKYQYMTRGYGREEVGQRKAERGIERGWACKKEYEGSTKGI